MAEIPETKIEAFLKQVMQIERRYANELKNVKSNRRDDIRERMEKFAAEELEK
jgi:hypothetical protein